jgi:hypothetical protein
MNNGKIILAIVLAIGLTSIGLVLFTLFRCLYSSWSGKLNNSK